MKARMEVTIDTTWTNQVICSVECELDNPHTITAQMLSELMVQRLRFLAEEVRHANERGAAELIDDGAAEADTDARLAGGPERERLAFEEMRRNRDPRDAT